MNLRHRTAALGGAAVLCVAGLALAPAATADEEDTPDSLYGTADPTHDGVWRHSLALLALEVTSVRTAPEAVDWLAAQQCADGAFPAYRADPDAACPEGAADTNATALAVQALTAAGGHEEETRHAVDWLRSVQNDDGGWPYLPGDDTDANSTALVAGALTIADTDGDAGGANGAGDAAGTADALAALGALQLDCAAAEPQRGAFAWQPDADSGVLYPDDAATADAVLAAYGSGLIVPPAGGADVPVRPQDCDAAEDSPEDTAGDSDDAASAAAGAAYLAGTLDARGGYLTSPLADTEDQPDYGATARAVLALAAGEHVTALEDPLQWLRDHHTDWEGLHDSPAALATLILAAHAGGDEPTDFGGTDLVAALTDLGPAPQEQGTGAADDDSDGGAAWALWVLGACVLAGAGVGLLASLHRRHRAQRAADPDASADGDAEQERTS